MKRCDAAAHHSFFLEPVDVVALLQRCASKRRTRATRCRSSATPCPIVMTVPQRQCSMKRNKAGGTRSNEERERLRLPDEGRGSYSEIQPTRNEGELPCTRVSSRREECQDPEETRAPTRGPELTSVVPPSFLVDVMPVPLPRSSFGSRSIPRSSLEFLPRPSSHYVNSTTSTNVCPASARPDSVSSHTNQR